MDLLDDKSIGMTTLGRRNVTPLKFNLSKVGITTAESNCDCWIYFH